MKRFYRVAVAVVLATAAGVVAASNGSLTQFKPQVMPVLVRVDSHGKVTRISPSSELTPAFDRMLATSLNAWITKPAVINGRAISTEMIVNVALRVSPREDGKYDAAFAYVSSSATPYGSSHWVTIDGNRLALANDENFHRGNRNDAPSGSPSNSPRYSNGSSQGASRNAPASLPQVAAPGSANSAPSRGK